MSLAAPHGHAVGVGPDRGRGLEHLAARLRDPRLPWAPRARMSQKQATARSNSTTGTSSRTGRRWTRFSSVVASSGVKDGARDLR